MCIYVYYYSVSLGLNVKILFKFNSTSFSFYVGDLFKRTPLVACFYFIFVDISLSVMHLNAMQPFSAIIWT